MDTINSSFQDVGEVFYYLGDKRVTLYPDPQVFAVRLEPPAQDKLDSLSPEARKILEEAEPVTFIPREGLNVFRSESGFKSIAVLRKEAGVANIMPAFRSSPEGKDRVFVTPRLLVQFRPALNQEIIAGILKRLGLRILSPLAYAGPNGFLLEAVPGLYGLGAIAAAKALTEQKLVLFAEPDLLQQRHMRTTSLPDVSAAVYLGEQWHLKSTSVFDAWQQTRGSASICIAILDDGVDLYHPEFNILQNTGQPKICAQFDFATGTPDGSPKTYLDKHGTACAGVAAAAGVRAAGAAPGCSLMIGRIPDWLGSSDEASMFQWAADNGADVISCSWGPGEFFEYPLPTATRLAIHYCLTNGRGGKGIPIFWAAGNGNELVSTDGYACNPDVMAIAACTQSETRAPYSDFGPEIFACAPSNSAPGDPAIFTTDRRGPDGYNIGTTTLGDVRGDYTNDFGGTSSASPLAAGIAALVLSENPDLTAAQVREVLRATADCIGDESSYDANGHNDLFGYGRLNAAMAVRAATQFVQPAQMAPTIRGPETWPRNSPPPIFVVNPDPNSYYAVEFAAEAKFLDSANSGGRNATNFYGSWSDTPFQTSPTYTMPASVWAHLNQAERLWYRVWSSASSTAYVDFQVSVPDNQAANAPVMEILPDENAPVPSMLVRRRTLSELAREMPNDRGFEQPWIEGPLRWKRNMEAPTFRIALDPTADYQVEVAVDPEFFDQRISPDKVNMALIFRSGWKKLAKKSPVLQPGYLALTLSQDNWNALLGAKRLYYRLMVNEAAPVYSPIFILELTGERPKPLPETVVQVREDEMLWRWPVKKDISVKDNQAIKEKPHPAGSQLSLSDDNERIQAVIEGNTSFAFALYERLKESNENIVLAPFSITTVLAPVYAGAHGSTEQQMAKALRFPPGQEELHDAFASLQSRINEVQRTGEVEWSLANALWPQTKYRILPEYLNFVKEHYDAPVMPVDYIQKTEAARNKINRWVAEKTRDKIKELIQPGVLNTNVRLTLTNAIYFKGNWASQFDHQLTQDAPFYCTSGAQASVPMMVQTRLLRYAELPDLQLLELPYVGDDLAMLLALPAQGRPEPSLEVETWQGWLQRLEEKTVQVWLPRFRIEAAFGLNENLIGLGMVDAFDIARADFSGITGRAHLYLGPVLHQACMDVNEEGSTAAAASAAILQRKAMPLAFRADRPFLFTIYERSTSSLVFIGRLGRPGGE